MLRFSTSLVSLAFLPYRIPDETGLSPYEVHQLLDFVWT